MALVVIWSEVLVQARGMSQRLDRHLGLTRSGINITLQSMRTPLRLMVFRNQRTITSCKPTNSKWWGLPGQ